MRQRLCAVRLPGTSRTRFVDAGSIECEPGDRVVVATDAGDEAAQVVIAPSQWMEPVSMPDVPVVSRLLQDGEREQLARHAQRVRDLIPPAADLFRSRAPDCVLIGLRLTLDGRRAVATFRGVLPEAEGLTSALADVLELDVVLERDPVASLEDSLLSGATGDLDYSSPQTFRELLEARMDVLRDSSTAAPQGLPRLNSKVWTPQGTGRLIAVDIRHWKATVVLDHGDEVTVRVDELSVT